MISYCTISYWGDILINIVAAIIFLVFYEVLLKRLFVFSKYKGLNGYYLVCSQGGQVFYNSPEGLPNFLKIRISFWNPNVLITKSKDFDKTYLKKWKVWTGKIVMYEFTNDYGSGFYVYEEGSEPGLHEIFIKDRAKGTILVRVTDYGRANLKERKDNTSILQIWKKVDKDDKIIDDLKKLM